MSTVVKNGLINSLNPDILVENIWLVSILSVFLTMYGPRLHPKLPVGIKNLFNNTLFRATILFLIAYMAHRDFTAAVVISIIFMVTLNMVHTNSVLENMVNKGFSEKFTVNGPPVANCRVYLSSDENKLGTKFYPLNDNPDAVKIRNGNTLKELPADIVLDKE